MSLRLDELPLRRHATISGIDWEGVDPAEAKRLREFGFDEGVAVMNLHTGPLGRDPIACRVGRMTIAMRRKVAGAIHVTESIA